MATHQSTEFSRHIVIHGTEHLYHVKFGIGLVPLANPGSFKRGIYRGDVNPVTYTATLTRIGELP